MVKRKREPVLAVPSASRHARRYRRMTTPLTLAEMSTKMSDKTPEELAKLMATAAAAWFRCGLYSTLEEAEAAVIAVEARRVAASRGGRLVLPVDPEVCAWLDWNVDKTQSPAGAWHWHEADATHTLNHGALYRAYEDLEDVPTVDGVRLTWRLYWVGNYRGKAEQMPEIRGSWEADSPDGAGIWYGRWPDEAWQQLNPLLLAEFRAKVTHVFKGELYSAIHDGWEGTPEASLNYGLYDLNDWAIRHLTGPWPRNGPSIRGFSEGGEQQWIQYRKGEWPEYWQVLPVKVGEIPEEAAALEDLNAKAKADARKPWPGQVKADAERKVRIETARVKRGRRAAREAAKAAQAEQRAAWQTEKLKAGRKPGGIGTGGV